MSAATDQRVPTLADLEKWARNPSDDNWPKLLRVLTDLFVANIESHAKQHGDAYSEIVCRLLDEVATDVRTELSERVAPLEKFPGQVVRRLANDQDDSVAGPVLEHSPALSESDLLEIIEKMLPERSLAITRRKEIGRKITDVLVAQGDSQIVRSVAGNPGAAFSDRTMRIVAEKAKSDPDLQGRLVGRGDISHSVAVQLTPFLPQELKDRLNVLDASESGSLLESLSEVTGDSGGTKPSRKNQVEARVAIDEVRAGNATMDETAAKIAALGHVSVLFMFLGEMAGVAEKTIAGSFTSKNGTPFAVFCKGLRLSQPAFTSIAQLRAKRLGTSAADSIRYIDGYAKLSANEAEKTLKMLQKKRENPAGEGGA